MKFNIVAIITIGLAFLVAAIWYSIKYAFSPEKCPICGSLMNSRFDEKNMEFEYECPYCGHKEIMKI